MSIEFRYILSVLFVVILIFYRVDFSSSRFPFVTSSETFPLQTKTQTKKLVLIVSKRRSGSSITARILSHSPHFYFSFEPLNVAKMSNYSLDSPDKIDLFLDMLWNCNDNWIEAYWKRRHDLNWDSYTSIYRDLCYVPDKEVRSCDLIDTNIDLELCKRASVHVMKTVYLKLSDLSLFMRRNSNIKVIYLVRDPRGTQASRKDIKQFFPSMQFSTNFSRLCAEISDDLSAAQSFSVDFPLR